MPSKKKTAPKGISNQVKWYVRRRCILVDTLRAEVTHMQKDTNEGVRKAAPNQPWSRHELKCKGDCSPSYISMPSKNDPKTSATYCVSYGNKGYYS